jgi:hypothetical protein
MNYDPAFFRMPPDGLMSGKRCIKMEENIRSIARRFISLAPENVRIRLENAGHKVIERMGEMK